jgi:hypothetical protein
MLLVLPSQFWEPSFTRRLSNRELQTVLFATKGYECQEGMHWCSTFEHLNIILVRDVIIWGVGEGIIVLQHPRIAGMFHDEIQQVENFFDRTVHTQVEERGSAKKFCLFNTWKLIFCNALFGLEVIFCNPLTLDLSVNQHPNHCSTQRVHAGP